MRNQGRDSGMNGRRVPSGIGWVVAGVVLIICPFVNRYDTWDHELLIGGIICCLIGAAWIFAREFMRYHYCHVYGICAIMMGARSYMQGGIFLTGGVDGLFLIILGALILFLQSA